MMNNIEQRHIEVKDKRQVSDHLKRFLDAKREICHVYEKYASPGSNYEKSSNFNSDKKYQKEKYKLKSVSPLLMKLQKNCHCRNESFMSNGRLYSPTCDDIDNDSISIYWNKEVSQNFRSAKRVNKSVLKNYKLCRNKISYTKLRSLKRNSTKINDENEIDSSKAKNTQTYDLGYKLPRSLNIGGRVLNKYLVLKKGYNESNDDIDKKYKKITKFRIREIGRAHV